MTNFGFPLEGPYNFAKESDLTQRLSDVLTDAGWEVWRFSAHRSLPKQLEGWVDIVAVRDGMVLFIEAKTPTGQMRECQLETEARMRPHMSRMVKHLVIQDVRQLLTPWVTPLEDKDG